jgi:nitrate/nitrite-specific signal transduction histidine kinase
MSDVVQSVRQLLQDFIAPEFRELKGDVKLVDTKIDSEAGQLRADIRRFEGKVDSGFAQMRSLLENASLRAELEAARDIANLRERVTRLEVERGSSRQ